MSLECATLFCIHPPVGGHLSWPYILAIVNTVAIDTDVSIVSVICIFSSSRYLHTNNLVGLYDSFTFSFRGFHTDFHNG